MSHPPSNKAYFFLTAIGGIGFTVVMFLMFVVLILRSPEFQDSPPTSSSFSSLGESTVARVPTNVQYGHRAWNVNDGKSLIRYSFTGFTRYTGSALATGEAANALRTLAQPIRSDEALILADVTVTAEPMSSGGIFHGVLHLPFALRISRVDHQQYPLFAAETSNVGETITPSVTPLHVQVPFIVPGTARAFRFVFGWDLITPNVTMDVDFGNAPHPQPPVRCDATRIEGQVARDCHYVCFLNVANTCSCVGLCRGEGLPWETPDASSVDLAVQHTGGSAGPLTLGGQRRYTFTIWNRGAIRATNVRLNQKLPEGVRLLVTDTSPECFVASHSHDFRPQMGPSTITCTVSSLDAGGQKEIHLSLNMATAVARGRTYLFSATVTSDQPDKDLTNNQSTPFRVQVQ